MPGILVTGKPGHGKTLWTVYNMAKRAKEENRVLYVSGIPDLKIPHEELKDPKDWHTLPDGALIVIDEAQRVFPVRAAGSRVPEHVQKIETHRHHGHDLVLITQHPKLLDSHVTRLIERHIHVRRQFGTHNALIHEWAEVRNPDARAELKAAITTAWRYPKDVFNLYRSSTIHTVKRRIPYKIIIGFVGLPLAVVFAVFMVKYLQHYATGGAAPGSDETEVSAEAGASSPFAVPAGGAGVPRVTASDPASYKPRVEGFPHTAPAYDSMTAQPSDLPLPKACVQMADKCRCFTDQGTAIAMPADVCKNIVNNGYFDPYLTARSRGSESREIGKPL